MLVAATWWFINLAPHKTHTVHTGFLWGLLHGILMVPNLLYELVNNRVAIYQAGNSGIVYDLGYVLGVLLVYGGGIVVVRRRVRFRRRYPVGP